MATIKISYATAAALTISLASKADSTAQESTAIDNTSNLYVDAMVRVQVKLQTGTPSNYKAVMIYAYGSEDGTNYTDNATGTDAVVTMRVPNNFRLLDTILMPDSGGLTYKSNPCSVASVFGGVMPRKWGVVVQNLSGIAFTATGSDHVVEYTGIYYTVV